MILVALMLYAPVSQFDTYCDSPTNQDTLQTPHKMVQKIFVNFKYRNGSNHITVPVIQENIISSAKHLNQQVTEVVSRCNSVVYLIKRSFTNVKSREFLHVIRCMYVRRTLF